jgi:hypothetical protein
VAVVLHQPEQGRKVTLLQREQLDGSANRRFHESEERIGTEPRRQEMTRFGEHGPGRHEWLVEATECSGRLLVVTIASISEREPESGINQDHESALSLDLSG